MLQTKDMNWEKAKEHLDEITNRYKRLVGIPGVNTSLALTLVMYPLAFRYDSGERTQELYNEMLEVE